VGCPKEDVARAKATATKELVMAFSQHKENDKKKMQQWQKTRT
jgi:hypothetical protein